jgi:copper chaperone
MVPNVSCDHCVNTIRRAVGALAGVQTVEGNPSTKQIDVVFDPPATKAQIVAAMTEWEYPPAE